MCSSIRSAVGGEALRVSTLADFADAAKLHQSFDSFCLHKLQETNLDCTIAIDNFCLHYCNWQHFYSFGIDKYCINYSDCGHVHAAEQH